MNTIHGQNPVKLFRVDFSFNITMTSIQNMTIFDTMQHIHLKESKRKDAITSVSQRLVCKPGFTEYLYLGYATNYIHGSIPGSKHRIQMRK